MRGLVDQHCPHFQLLLTQFVFHSPCLSLSLFFPCVFAGFERGGSDARHGRRAPVEFAQSKTQAAQPVPQGRLRALRAPSCAPALILRGCTPSLPTPDHLIVLHTAPMDSTKLPHALPLRVAPAQPATASLGRLGFFSPKRPSLFLFVDRPAHVHTVQHGAFCSCVPILFQVQHFCTRGALILGSLAASVWSGCWLVATYTKSSVCKNWASTDVSDSITQDTTNNNAEHLSNG